MASMTNIGICRRRSGLSGSNQSRSRKSSTIQFAIARTNIRDSEPIRPAKHESNAEHISHVGGHVPLAHAARSGTLECQPPHQLPERHREPILGRVPPVFDHPVARDHHIADGGAAAGENEVVQRRCPRAAPAMLGCSGSSTSQSARAPTAIDSGGLAQGAAPHAARHRATGECRRAARGRPRARRAAACAAAPGIPSSATPRRDIRSPGCRSRRRCGRPTSRKRGASKKPSPRLASVLIETQTAAPRGGDAVEFGRRCVRRMHQAPVRVHEPGRRATARWAAARCSRGRPRPPSAARRCGCAPACPHRWTRRPRTASRKRLERHGAQASERRPRCECAAMPSAPLARARGSSTARRNSSVSMAKRACSGFSGCEPKSLV